MRFAFSFKNTNANTKSSAYRENKLTKLVCDVTKQNKATLKR